MPSSTNQAPSSTQPTSSEDPISASAASLSAYTVAWPVPSSTIPLHSHLMTAKSEEQFEGQRRVLGRDRFTAFLAVLVFEWFGFSLDFKKPAGSCPGCIGMCQKESVSPGCEEAFETLTLPTTPP